MLKYLGFSAKDWITAPFIVIWMMLLAILLAPAIVAEFLVDAAGRQIRENRFYERHDFGIVDYDECAMDEVDQQALDEMKDDRVIGNFIYRSKVFNLLAKLALFGDKGELR